jgi:hypothetical protein
VYERITAAEIRPGDKVARARSHAFVEIVEVKHGPIAASLYARGTRFDRRGLPSDSTYLHARPRLTAQWWREVEA